MAPNRTASASGHCIPGGAMNAFVHLDVRSFFSLIVQIDEHRHIERSEKRQFKAKAAEPEKPRGTPRKAAPSRKANRPKQKRNASSKRDKKSITIR